MAMIIDPRIHSSRIYPEMYPTAFLRYPLPLTCSMLICHCRVSRCYAIESHSTNRQWPEGVCQISPISGFSTARSFLSGLWGTLSPRSVHSPYLKASCRSGAFSLSWAHSIRLHNAAMAQSFDVHTDVPGTVYLVDSRFIPLCSSHISLYSS